MSNRPIFISHLHGAALAGMEARIAWEYNIEIGSYHDDLIFTSMIQAGARSILSSSGEIPSHLKKSGEFSKRFKEIDPLEYTKVYDEVRSFINSHTIATIKENEDPRTNLLVLICELIFSLKNNTSVVSVLSMPRIDRLAGIVTPALLSMTKILVDSITPSQMSLPVPKLEIERSKLAILEDMVTSSVYDRYSLSHDLLGDSSSSIDKKQKDMLFAARKLREVYGASMIESKTVISLLKSSTKLVDALWGKIPGSIAEILVGGFTDIISDRRNLVIYDYRKIHLDILNAHYSGVAGGTKKLRITDSE